MDEVECGSVDEGGGGRMEKKEKSTSEFFINIVKPLQEKIMMEETLNHRHTHTHTHTHTGHVLCFNLTRPHYSLEHKQRPVL